ncbi:MAG: hypothetical protein A3J97_14470 [Spirochaetes bacterium RIFOXYC1_FULL_54_7]|nr:MAG: hypothetical protein A3J97_14470 [Spirochaetes bacterium RIFOXYC1_FULL_54_7]
MAELILIVDDEKKIADMVARYLENAGFRTLSAFDGGTALRLWKQEAPDCVILDVNMPGLNGLDVAREIRKTSMVPLVFLSALTEEADRVVGLELGGDDYVPKPFSPRELVARVRAILRRSSQTGQAAPAEGALHHGGLDLDPVKRTVQSGGLPLNLTAIQFDILALLMREPGRVFSRTTILHAASGSDFEGYERTVDAHIKNIRKALNDDDEHPRWIGTVRGIGYKFLEQPNDP